MVMDPRDSEREELIEHARATCKAFAEMAVKFAATSLIVRVLVKELGRLDPSLRGHIKRAGALYMLDQIKARKITLNRRGRRALRRKLPRAQRSLVK